MPLETPRLDDRAFDDLVTEAIRRIPLYTPEWTDHNLSDPGITLIELFAWLMDIVLYRLNRVPEKHYIKFMELLGMKLREAEPAQAPVTFWLSAPQEIPITIPAATEVATTRTENDPAVVFTTDEAAVVRVAVLERLLVSRRDAEGRRSYREQNLQRLAIGFDGFPIFSNPPQPGDALYFCVSEDLSRHVFGVEMDVDNAGGAGIDPSNPPYVWEVMSKNQPREWTVAEVDQDTTRGINVPGRVRLHLPRMAQGAVNNQSGYWIRLKLEPQPDTPMYRVSPRISRLTVASWGVTTDATHATRIANEPLGRSDGSADQKFFLQMTPILRRARGENIVLRYDDGREEEEWTEVPDFADSGPGDRCYTLDSQTGEIMVGPAMPQRSGAVRMYGAIPPQGAMLYMRAYRYGGGLEGNVRAGAINILKTSLPYIGQVRNRRDAMGGLDAESLEDAKLRLPGHLRSRARAVTAADFEYLAREAAPGMVGRVYCLQPPRTNLGEVKVLIVPRLANPYRRIPPNELALTDELRRRVTEYLDERRLISTRLEVVTPAYQWLSTRVRFRVSSHADPDEVRQAVENRLYTFLNPIVGGPDGDGWPFGRDLFSSDVMGQILTVPDVEFVRSVELFPVSYSGGVFAQGEATQEIPVVSHGLIASHQHDLQVE
ncbi:MAG: putative baseplate assembly protein [Anaerolineae bacterium]|nr:putative baseplate assembly protein [Anaerolineae bacterium]